MNLMSLFGKNKKAEPEVRYGLSRDETKEVIESAGLNIEKYNKGTIDKVAIRSSNIQAIHRYGTTSNYIFTKSYADWLTGHPEIFNTKMTEDIQTKLSIEPVVKRIFKSHYRLGEDYKGFQKHVDLSVESGPAKERFGESIEHVLVFAEFIDESLEKILQPTQKIQEAIINNPDSEAMKRLKEYLAESTDTSGK